MLISLMRIFLWSVMVLLGILLSLGVVAFSTLLERKLLGLSQSRLGPNSVSIYGVLQPVIDGVKLLFKEVLMTSLAQMVLLASSSALMLIFYFLIWTCVLPWGTSGSVLIHYSGMLLFVLLGFGTYTVMLLGWAFTSPFSKLGSLRGMLQSLSFEVALILILMVPLSFTASLSMAGGSKLGLEMLLWGAFWLILCLMESNRAPFDLLEGESELISGFNVETSSVPFVFVFLSEYGILFSLGAILSLGLFMSVSFLMVISVGFLLFVRSCYPRIRYDHLMESMWQSLLPLGLLLILLSFLLKSGISVMWHS